MEEKDMKQIFLLGDQRYRLKDECQEIVKVQQDDIDDMQKHIVTMQNNITAIVTRLNWLIGIASGVGGLFVAYLAKLIFGG